MESARGRKSLSAEQILTETFADTLSDVPSAAMSESDDDYNENTENESDTDFKPEIVRKIKVNDVPFV
jgi:hypothetical protein